MELNKKVIFLALLILIGANFCLARELEEPLPSIPGREAPTTTETTLGEYIVYTFELALMIGGIIAFATLIYGGFKYLTSGGNRTIVASSKKQILAGIIGLIILLGSYLILRTINPDLLIFPGNEGRNGGTLKPNQGVCFYTMYSQGAAGGERVCFTESKKEMPEGFDAKALEFISPKDKLFSVYTFYSKNWVGLQKNRKNEKDTPYVYPEELNSPKSFFIDWNDPGVYLYKGAGFQTDFPNYPYKLRQSSAASLDNYNNEIASIKFRNLGCTRVPGPDPDKDYYAPEVKYGAVLHKEEGFKGECSIIFGSPVDSTPADNCCVNYGSAVLSNDAVGSVGNNEASSITIFNHSCSGNPTGKVTFYDQIGRIGNSFTVNASQVGKFWYQDISYPFRGLEKILSFKIEGDFMVVLGQSSKFGNKCEVFRKTADSLKEHYILQHPENAAVRSIAIIPLQPSK